MGLNDTVKYMFGRLTNAYAVIDSKTLIKPFVAKYCPASIIGVHKIVCVHIFLLQLCYV